MDYILLGWAGQHIIVCIHLEQAEDRAIDTFLSLWIYTAFHIGENELNNDNGIVLAMGFFANM